MLKDEYGLLIGSLNAEKFRVFIQKYLEEKFAGNTVFITDGPYDDGNDLTIIFKEREIKKNIQVTIQKDNIEKKIKEDLEKSKSNVDKYKYMNRLDFYYSQKVTNTFKNTQKLLAEVEFDIDLNIYDGTLLSQELEHFPQVRNKLLQLLGLGEQAGFVKVDKQTKVVFDMLANSKETGEMKKQFVLSFILTFLFESPGSTIEALMDGVAQKLPHAPDEKFYRDNLSALKSKGIVTTDATRKKFSLSEAKTNEIDDIYAQALIHETQLRQAMEIVLDKHGLKGLVANLSEFVVKAYQDHYKMDIDEVSGKTKAAPSTKIMFELRSYLKINGINDENANEIAKDIFRACNDNEYLNKVGASILFANLYESNKLDEYLNNVKQDFYLDTQILLRLICLQYWDVDWQDIAYKSVKNFYETVNSSKHPITLHTSYNYLIEVAKHFQEALKLQRFYDLPNYGFAKKSRNIFCNFYFFLQESLLIEDDFTIQDFFEEMLGITMPAYDDPDFIFKIARRLSNLYSMLQIDVITVPFYDDFQAFRREYEIQLAYDDKYRPSKVIDNDVLLILHLSDLRNHVDERTGMRTEPFLVTWDKEFYSFRKTLMEKFQNLGYGYFYIYSPSKLSDRISISSFKLNPKSIDYNIISLTESNFNLLYKTASYVDVLSYFFVKRDLSELLTAQKLLDMERRSQAVDDNVVKEEVFEDSSAIQDVLLRIRKHYMDNSEKFTFDDVVELFEDNNSTDAVMDILDKILLNKIPNGPSISFSIYKEINDLIKSNKEK